MVGNQSNLEIYFIIIILELVFIADWWAGCKLYVYMSEEDKKTVGKTHGLLIMNHAYEIDWLLGWVFCEKIGVLGNCKA